MVGQCRRYVASEVLLTIWTIMHDICLSRDVRSNSQSRPQLPLNINRTFRKLLSRINRFRDSGLETFPIIICIGRLGANWPSSETVYNTSFEPMVYSNPVYAVLSDFHRRDVIQNERRVLLFQVQWCFPATFRESKVNAKYLFFFFFSKH